MHRPRISTLVLGFGNVPIRHPAALGLLLSLSLGTACVTPSTSTETSSASKSVRLLVRLSTHGNDVSFDQQSLQVPASRPVRIEFRNDAEPDSGIYHNVAIVRPGHEEAIMEVLDKADFDFMHVHDAFANSEHILATTRTISPGGSDTIEFEPDPGIYMYLCLIPGHGNVLGMKGYLMAR